MSPDLKESKPFCSPQDQIQWGILFLSRHLRGSSPWEREECLQDVWDWARKQGNLLCLQIIRDYRECLKEPTRRPQHWPSPASSVHRNQGRQPLKSMVFIEVFACRVTAQRRRRDAETAPRQIRLSIDPHTACLLRGRDQDRRPKCRSAASPTHPLLVPSPHKARCRPSPAPCRAANASRNSCSLRPHELADVRM